MENRSNTESKSGALQPLDESKVTELVGLITKHRVDVVRFIYSILPDYDAAEEVYQRTSIVMWKKFMMFKSGTSFESWAKRIAYYEVLDYRKNCARDRLEFWPNEIVETIAQTCFENEDKLKNLSQLLQSCLTKLNDKDKELLELRYQNPRTTSKAVASKLGKPAVTVYKGLNRIRRALFECVQRAMAHESRS